MCTQAFIIDPPCRAILILHVSDHFTMMAIRHTAVKGRAWWNSPRTMINHSAHLSLEAGRGQHHEPLRTAAKTAILLCSREGNGVYEVVFSPIWMSGTGRISPLILAG